MGVGAGHSCEYVLEAGLNPIFKPLDSSSLARGRGTTRLRLGACRRWHWDSPDLPYAVVPFKGGSAWAGRLKASEGPTRFGICYGNPRRDAATIT